MTKNEESLLHTLKTIRRICTEETDMSPVEDLASICQLCDEELTKQGELL